MPLDASTLRRMIETRRREIAELEAMLDSLDIANKPNGVDRAEALRAHCLATGINILPGDLVSANDAAKLTGLSMKTLRNRRSDLDDDLPSVDFNGRPAYRLADLARYRQ